MTTPTPAGWYPDTNAPGTERYWDGNAWTASTRPIGGAAPEPPAAPAAPAYGAPAAPAYGAPSAPSAPGYGAPSAPGYAAPNYGAPGGATPAYAAAPAKKRSVGKILLIIFLVLLVVCGGGGGAAFFFGFRAISAKLEPGKDYLEAIAARDVAAAEALTCVTGPDPRVVAADLVDVSWRNEASLTSYSNSNGFRTIEGTVGANEVPILIVLGDGDCIDDVIIG